MSTSSATTFHLNPSLFNPTLYDDILSLWFSKLPAGNKRGTLETAKQWWGAGHRSQAESDALDEECRKRYASALEAISPDHFPLPAWKSYADDLANARDIAGPFLAEVDAASSSSDSGRDGDKSAADTLLALTLLLDQIPRNLYRSPQTLPLVYRHYDRLAWTLLRAAPAALAEHPSFRGAPAYKQWFSLPLMHAEDLESQRLAEAYLLRCRGEAEQERDAETAAVAQQSLGFARSHRDIVERFGRFPHRNECLEREHEGEEGAWLRESGETFGVKQGQKDGQ